jgi:hypothetical protein
VNDAQSFVLWNFVVVSACRGACDESRRVARSKGKRSNLEVRALPEKDRNIDERVDDYSIACGRLVSGTNPASARSATERAVKAFDGL